MTSTNVAETLGVTKPRRTPEIVVGLDDSPAGHAALLWAAEQSWLTGVPLRVVHAWQMSALAATAVTSGAGEYGEAAAADARARATRWVLDTLGGDAATVRWTLDIAEGAPGQVLVSRSVGARLLVLGTRDHTGLHRAVLGSVSHYCLSHAAAPLVAVPAGDAASSPPAGVAGSGPPR
jgi:nucleotide-binding universal stress UspA family protein